MRLRWLDALVLFYGILLIAMGIYGYMATKHMPSLIAGCTAGVLVIGFAALTQSNPRVGRIGSAVIALLMVGMFTPKILDGKLDLAILGVASLIVFLCLAGGHFYAMSRRKANSSAQS